MYNKNMKRILLKIAYDGTNFHGWQRQDGLRTVQGEIEKAILSAFKIQTEVFASGRTDRGVHALGQMAHFDVDNSCPTNKIKMILNRILPPDIQILSAKKVPEDFHARFDAKAKTYLYKICTGERNCFLANRAAFIKNLSLPKLEEIASVFMGEHDFKGFCSSQTSAQNFVRKIYSIEITKKKSNIVFEITGNGFLMNMVRILVGSMVDYSLGKLSKEKILLALKSGQRSMSGRTMPPQGLYLKKVQY